MLSFPIALESLQPVSGRSSQVGQGGCGIQITELPSRDREQVTGKSFRRHTLEGISRALIFEALDHPAYVSWNDTIFKIGAP